MDNAQKKPRILMFGAGAVGGYIGGYLAHFGHDVVLIDPWVEHVEHIRRNGLRLEGSSEEECFTVQLPAAHLGELRAISQNSPVDIAFLGLKSYDTPWAAMMLRDVLSSSGYVITLQNAINEPVIASILGWSRTVGGIASKIVVELCSPGLIRRSIKKGGGGFEVFRIGETHGRITHRVQLLTDMLSQIDTAKAITNLWGERWSKVVQNAMSNAVSAATGLPTKTYIEHPIARRLAIRLAGEAAHVGRELGYDLEPINGQVPSLWIDAWREADGLSHEAGALQRAEEVLLQLAARMTSNARPSMAQDTIKGRRTEIDYLNGMIAREAKEHGLDAKANASVTEVVHKIEQRRLAPSLELIQAV